MMKFVKVRFYRTNSETEYTFIAEEDLNPDDIVVVDTKHGLNLATVISMTDTIPPFLDFDDVKYVVSKVDMDAYNRRKQQADRRKTLRMQMDGKVKELQNIAIYEALAANNPEMKELLDEFKTLI